MSETKKPNCYKCEFKGSVAGSCHSSCKHPAFEEATNDPLLQVMATFASVGRVAPVNIKSDKCVVEGHPQGIKNGWFNHPYNFDPTWLVSCNGFKEMAKS